MLDSSSDPAVLAYAQPGPYRDAVAIPPELQRPTPRAVIRKPTAPPSAAERVKARVVRVVVVVAVVAWAARKVADPIVFFRSPTVPATYVGKDSHWGGMAGRVDSVAYAYRANGVAFTARERVPADLYARISPATPLRVRTFAVGSWRYDRLDRSWAEFYEDWGFGLYWIGFGLTAAATAAVWKAWRHPARREWRTQCALVRRGTPAVARVVRIGAASFRLNGPDRITYEYVVRDWHRHGYLNRKADPIAGKLKVGDGVVVLYDPADPATHRTYDFMAVSAGPSASPGG